MTQQAIGNLGTLLLDFETTFKSDPTTPAAIMMPFDSSALTAKRNLTQSNTMTGRRDPTSPSRGNIDAGGQITVPLDARSFVDWLKLAFGVPTTTGSGPYVHVFNTKGTPKSAVIQQGFTDIGYYEKFNGCKVNSLGFNFGGEGDVSVTIDIMAAKSTPGTTDYDATPTERSLDKFSQFQVALKEGGAVLAYADTVSINVAFNLEGKPALGSNGEMRNVNEGKFGITGSISFMFEDSVLLAKARSGTETSLELTLTNGANIVDILMPEVKLTETSPAIDTPAGIMINMDYTAYYDNAVEDTAMQITVTNDVTSYA